MEFKQGIVLREALRTMRNSPVGYKPTVPFRETYGNTFNHKPISIKVESDKLIPAHRNTGVAGAILYVLSDQ